MDDGQPHPRRRAEDLNWWGRMPQWARGVSAVVALFVTGWTSSWAAQEYRGLPDTVVNHEERITALEEAQASASDRTNTNFVYVACRLDEIAAGARPSGRCSLILDGETREILRQLRTP